MKTCQTKESFKESIPEWVSKEIRETWRTARDAGSELEAFRILERMVYRLGYGTIKDNPSLAQST